MDHNGQQILIVEDEPAHVELIRRAFESGEETITLRVAGNLQQAQEHLQENEPSLIIADLRLPDGSAIELLPDSEESPRWPVVIMTARGDEQAAVDAMKAGALDYVVKSESILADMPHIAHRALREWNHIQERRKAELAVRDSEVRLRAVMSSSFDPMLTVGEDGLIQAASDSVESVFGWTPDELIGQNVELLMSEPYRFQHDKHFSQFRESGEPRMLSQVRELEGLRKDGSTFPCEVAVWQVESPGQGELPFTSVIRDITKRKLAEKLLQERIERYELIAKSANDAIWDWDVPSHRVYLSPRWMELLGLDPDEVSDREEEWSSRIHPDDSPRVLAALQAHLEGKTELFHEEYRLRCKDASYKWVLTRGLAQRDAVGNVVRMAGSDSDITKRKRAEKLLQEQIERYELVAAGANGAIWDWDVPNHRSHFSPRWKEIRGLAPHEVSDRTDEWSSRIHPDDTPRVMAAVQAHLEGKTEVFQEEYRTRCKDGSFIWILDRGLAKRDSKGNVVRMAGSESDITERKRAEETLADREQLYRNAIATADAVAYQFDFESNSYIHMDEGIERLIGYASADVTPAVWDAIGRQRIYYGEAKGLSRAEADRKYRAGELRLWKAEYQCILADDREVWLADSSVPVRNGAGRVIGCLGILRDITERKQAEVALRASEARSRTLLEGSPVCIKIVDLDSRLQYMSAAGREQLKISEIEPFYGCTFPPDLYPKRWRRLAAEHLERAKSGETSSVECCVLDTAGNELWYDTTFVPARDKEGRIEHVIVTSVNITDRKQTDEKIRQHQEELAHVNRVSTMGELATGLAHELNQPLTAIATYASIGAAKFRIDTSHADDDELSSVMQKIVGQALRAGEIIRRLRTLVARHQPEFARFRVNDSVRNAASLLATERAENRVELRLDLDDDLPELMGDAIQIEQVILNLMRNAIEAMPDGNGDRRELTVGTSLAAGNEIHVSVSDTGPGIPHQQRERVFDPFYSTKPDGMGMGLSISTSIAEAHHGQLTATANADGGTTFQLALPVLPALAEQAAESVSGGQ